jgi:hypothetical protein
LNTIAAINANTGRARMDLQGQEAAQGDQRLQAYIGEADKQWNQDKNMPYQLRIAALREKLKHQQELQLAGVAYEAQTSSSMLSSVGGGMGGG